MAVSYLEFLYFPKMVSKMELKKRSLNFYYNLIYVLNNFLNPIEIKKSFNLLKDFRKTKLTKKSLNKYFSFSNDSKKKAIVFCYPDINSILLISFFIISLKLKGYKVIGILHSFNFVIQKIYKLFGVNSFIFLCSAYKEKKQNCQIEFDKESLKKIEYKKIPIGKIVLSNLMRKYKSSNFNFFDRDIIKKQLDLSINIINLMQSYIDEIKPEILITQDRGYTPEAEIFETCLINNVKSVEFHVAHRSEFLVFKKYNLKSKFKHFNSLSKDNIELLKKTKISISEKRKFFKELNYCYNKGRWYEEVGTQFKKKKINKKQFFKKYNLNPELKVAVLFSHIFWDGTFFFGKDIFLDYEEWFKETLKIMIKNKEINWIIKAHPANSVKDYRDKKKNKSELDAIHEVVKKLPEHIKFIDCDDSTSTISYFEFIDYCLTVRGTVGIEAACWGVPVITAGSGRYDNIGFTLDHSSKTSYLRTLNNILEIKKYDDSKKNLAIAFAHRLFCRRVFETKNIKFSFIRDQNFTLSANLNTDDIYDLENLEMLSKWLENNDEDYINDEL